MKRLAWLLAGCLSLQPLALNAAPKEEDPIKKQLSESNKIAAKKFLLDDLDAALEEANKALSQISEDQYDSFKSNKDFLDLLLLKGGVLLEQKDYDGSKAAFNSVCKYLKGSRKNDCLKNVKAIEGIAGTTIEFFVANSGPRTSVFIGNTKKEYCFLSEDPTTAADPLNCKKKNAIEPKVKPQKGLISRPGFVPVEFTITIVTNKAHRFPEKDGESLTLKDAPAPLEIALSPADATLLFDGQASATKLITDPGAHTITVSAPGHVERKLDITSKEGGIFLNGARLEAEKPLAIQLNPYVEFDFKTPNTKLYEGDSTTPLTLVDGNRLEITESLKLDAITAKASGAKPKALGAIDRTSTQPIEISLDPLGAFFVLKNAPEGAVLSVDGVKISSPTQEFALSEDPNKLYTVKVEKPKYATYSKSTALAPETSVEVTIDEMKTTRSPLLIPGLAIGGVGLVGAGAFGLLALQEKNDLEGKDGQGGLAQQACVLSNHPELSELPEGQTSSECIGNTNQLAFHESFTKRQNLARVSDGALILGVAGAGIGVFALVTQKNRTSTGKLAEKKLEVSVGPSSVSFAAKF